MVPAALSALKNTDTLSLGVELFDKLFDFKELDKKINVFEYDLFGYGKLSVLINAAKDIKIDIDQKGYKINAGADFQIDSPYLPQILFGTSLYVRIEPDIMEGSGADGLIVTPQLTKLHPEMFEISIGGFGPFELYLPEWLFTYNPLIDYLV